MRGPPKKTGPVKKEWHGVARARTGADGAVVLNLRRGPGAYALLLRADGQLTRAGQHYYSHLGLRPPSKDFDCNQPSSARGPTTTEEARALSAGRRAPADQAGQGLLPRQVNREPGPRAGDHGRNADAGYKRRDWLPVKAPAHLTEEQVAQRVRQQVEALLGNPAAPILGQDLLHPKDPWVVSTQSTHYRNFRTEVETLLRQRMRGLRSVSFQLPCKENVLPSAFKDKPSCCS